MTGDDSPTPNRKEEFSFGRSTPPPTTSSYQPKPEQADIKTIAEPNKEDKEKDKEKEKEGDKEKDEKDDVGVLRPDANPGYKPEEKREADDGKDRDRGDRDRPRGEDCSEKKCNGDRLDGQWIPAADIKVPPSEDEDDSNCTVKCLYYTMQCCECSIS